MAINFFLQSRDFGGAEKFAYDLVLELAKKNQLINFYTNNTYLLRDLSNKKNLKVTKIPIYTDFASNGKGLIKSFLLSPFAIFYFLIIISKIRKQKEKQTLICSGFSEKIIIAPLAKLFGLPIFFIEYGPLSPIFDKLIGIPKLLYHLSKDFAKKIIVPSQNTKLALKNTFSKNKIIFIPCGANTPKIKNEKVKINSLSIISRLEKGKGQDLAIKAFLHIKREFPNAELRIIGKGSFKQELEKISGSDRQIKFLDYVENKQKIIEESEIVICPSVWTLEGFGLTIIEAMALGKPIVAFDRAPGNEILINNRNAVLAKDGDYKDLAKKITKLFKDKKLSKRIAENAKKDFTDNYKIEKIADKYLTLLQN